MNPGWVEATRVSLTGDRDSNQDRCLLLSNEGSTLVVVADGLGGHPRGEIAAQLLVDVCESLFRQASKPLRDPEQFMSQCVHKAHKAIIAFGKRQMPPVNPRTTAVIAVMQAGSIYWAHVGDSRLYLVREGKVQARTLDHSRIRSIRPDRGSASRMRPSITRCLGGLEQPPEITVAPPTELCPGDTVLLCSDGLWAQVPQNKLVQTLSASSNLDCAVRSLAKYAVQRGHPHSDNVTAVGVCWHPHEQTTQAMGGPGGRLNNPSETALRQRNNGVQPREH